MVVLFFPNSTQATENTTNGHTAIKNEHRTPIGFYSYEQRMEMGKSTDERKNASGQVWTDVDRAELPLFKDKFTIEHTYVKGGKKKTVHYTLRMVTSRIRQYERELQEATDKGLAESVIENRRKWLSYWKEKRRVLLQKSEMASV